MNNRNEFVEREVVVFKKTPALPALLEGINEHGCVILEHEDEVAVGIVSVLGYLENMWDWKKTCGDGLGGKYLSDIDGHYCWSGNQLFVETKLHVGLLNPYHVINALTLANEYGQTYLYVFGEKNNPRYYLEISPRMKSGSHLISTNNSEFPEILKEWKEWAEDNPKISPKIYNQYKATATNIILNVKEEEGA
jgi:hypothetical protein